MRRGRLWALKLQRWTRGVFVDLLGVFTELQLTPAGTPEPSYPPVRVDGPHLGHPRAAARPPLAPGGARAPFRRPADLVPCHQAGAASAHPATLGARPPPPGTPGGWRVVACHGGLTLGKPLAVEGGARSLVKSRGSWQLLVSPRGAPPNPSGLYAEPWERGGNETGGGVGEVSPSSQWDTGDSGLSSCPNKLPGAGRAWGPCPGPGSWSRLSPSPGWFGPSSRPACLLLPVIASPETCPCPPVPPVLLSCPHWSLSWSILSHLLCPLVLVLLSRCSPLLAQFLSISLHSSQSPNPTCSICCCCFAPLLLLPVPGPTGPPGPLSWSHLSPAPGVLCFPLWAP